MRSNYHNANTFAFKHFCLQFVSNGAFLFARLDAITKAYVMRFRSWAYPRTISDLESVDVDVVGVEQLGFARRTSGVQGLICQCMLNSRFVPREMSDRDRGMTE